MSGFSIRCTANDIDPWSRVQLDEVYHWGHGAGMLIIFSAPKPFVGHIGIIQRNAVRSWTLLQPAAEVILFGNEEGVAEAADDLGVRHVPNIARNEYGTPLVNDIFEKAQSLANQDMLCYVNADIILMSDFIAAANRVSKSNKKNLVLGQRWDLEINEPIDFKPGWETNLRKAVAQHGQLHPRTGIDYFLFSKGIWQTILPFAIGRTAWDNWLIYEAGRVGARVIDATPAVKIVHQNHDYFHVEGGEKGAWEGPEARRNQALANGGIHTTENATWLLTPFGLIPALSPPHLYRRIRIWLDHFPNLRNFIKNVSGMNRKS